MINFGDVYSKYYDLLYQDKDYSGETEYLKKLIRGNHPNPKTILELGCGTGKHAELLANKGFDLFCVDMSRDMLEAAKKRCHYLDKRISFYESDITTFKTDQLFDTVVSLFHVMSYQCDNKELNNAFKTASQHLKKDGIFIFDFWYGPAVLNDKPQNRIKKISNKELDVIRFAEPQMRLNDNIVEVNYDIIVKEKPKNTITEMNEKHTMRYLFLPEIKYYLENNQFEFINAYQWMSLDQNISNAWYVVVIAKKI